MTDQSEPGTRPRLTAVTMNVLGPSNRDWQRRRPVLAELLRGAAADVYALQEVPADRAEIASLIGPGHHLTFLPSPSSDGVGAVLATRMPHECIEVIDQHLTARTESFPWCATSLIALESDVGSVLVAHHKPSWQFGYEYEREQQALQAALAIEEHRAEFDHAIVLGDFDATPDSGSLRFWRGRASIGGTSVSFQDAWEIAHPYSAGLTFAGDNPLVAEGEVATAISRRIDYILIGGGQHGPTLHVDECRLLGTRPLGGVWASDHFGVMAVLSRPDHAPGTWRTERR
jgi:endonuclease/exonuclease/phosphatase family metal-dependent hydrolase